MSKIKICKKNVVSILSMLTNLTTNKVFNSEYSILGFDKTSLMNVDSFTHESCADEFSVKYYSEEKKLVIGELNGFGYSVPFGSFYYKEEDWVFIENPIKNTVLVLKASTIQKNVA